MRVCLSLGSNLGDRLRNLRVALGALDSRVDVLLRTWSHAYVTQPLGDEEQPSFVNMAAEIETTLEPLELLHVAKAIEVALGRRPGERWGPRTIDIDIVLCGLTVLDTPTLTVPHKEFRNRAFVLVPLVEIAPEAVDPVTGCTVAELAARPAVGGLVSERLPETLEPLRLEPRRDRDG